MFKRISTLMGVALLTLSFAACHNKHVSNPIAQVDSKQPDKILYDRAMDAMKHNKFDVARLTLQTLINTYPDSEFVARAKLAIGDSWYAEGGSAAMIQAENEYKDFQTFFPNMPEAAEAQLKIANIHYREMEKPDRDYTHALRAEEEYRQLIIQYPDNKLVPEAKERLLEVQEVLAEREFRIGKFYYSRQSWAAAVARLKSLTDAYPLYSDIDEALFLLGGGYEQMTNAYRAVQGMPESIKGTMIKQNEDKAAAAYDRILTRYPMMPHAEDAKKALEAMHRPVPTATPEAIAQNKKEMESRGKPSMWGSVMGNLHKGPDSTVIQATKVGEPTLVDPPQTSAPVLINSAQEQLKEMITTMNTANSAGGDGKAVSIEQVKPGATPPPNEPIPRSDSGQATDNSAVPELQPIQSTDSTSATPASTTPPTQVNEVENPANSSNTAAAPASSSSSSSSGSASTGTDQNKDAKPDYSTSKKKEKKGLRKIVPF
jgi:outer membrane protein assembly factor BamD